MILDDLYAYYERKPKADTLNMVGDPDEVCPRFWTMKNVSWEISFTAEGRVVACVPKIAVGTKDRPMPRLLPDISRSSGIRAYALADNSMYVLGDDPKRGSEAHEAFRTVQHAVLDGVDDEAARGFLALVDRNPDELELDEETRAALRESKGLIAFHLADDPGWVELQNRAACKRAWESHAAREEAQGAESGTCLVTGETGPIARLFPQVTGVPGANGSGASLVSFNQPAFLSYGQEAASISQDAAFKSGEALRYLLKSPAHRTLVGEDSVVFWTDSDTRPSLNLLSLGLNADDRIAQARVSVRESEDRELLASIQNDLLLIRRGKPLPGVDESDRFHVLGIAPYQARLAIRFYEEGTLGALRRNLESFLSDTEMVGVEPRSMKSYLEQVAPLGDRKNIPSPLITSCMRALLRGTAFPDALFEQLLVRMHADRASKNRWDMGLRAAMMRAYLVRRERLGETGNHAYERSLTVGLNETNDDIGYLLGRLFAVLEKVQIDAIGGGKGANVNATIRDRYMGAASTTPARVFPQLMKLAQHHVSKSEYGGLIDRRIQQIMALMPAAPFPATLDYEQQGLFFIGYYQQKEALFARREPQQAGMPGASGSEDAVDGADDDARVFEDEE